MRGIMRRLRGNPPEKAGSFRVLAVRDYLTGTRSAGGRTEPLGFPLSDVMYFELEHGHWLCVRPSGTEPKIKLYISARSDLSMADAEQLAQVLQQAGEAWLS